MQNVLVVAVVAALALALGAGGLGEGQLLLLQPSRHDKVPGDTDHAGDVGTQDPFGAGDDGDGAAVGIPSNKDGRHTLEEASARLQDLRRRAQLLGDRQGDIDGSGRGAVERPLVAASAAHPGQYHHGWGQQSFEQMWDHWNEQERNDLGEEKENREEKEEEEAVHKMEEAETADQRVLLLKTPEDKIKAIRNKMVKKIMMDSKQLLSSDQSLTSIALLAVGALLLDVLRDSLSEGTSDSLSAPHVPSVVSNLLGRSMQESSARGLPNGISGREALLPGLGLFGDSLNNVAEIALNMLTIYLYKEESPDCGERLLCESNQQASSRGLFDAFVTYISGFAISFFLHEAPVSKNLKAMRAGRKGLNCIELYPNCSISL